MKHFYAVCNIVLWYNSNTGNKHILRSLIEELSYSPSKDYRSQPNRKDNAMINTARNAWPYQLLNGGWAERRDERALMTPARRTPRLWNSEILQRGIHGILYTYSISVPALIDGSRALFNSSAWCELMMVQNLLRCAIIEPKFCLMCCTRWYPFAFFLKPFLHWLTD